MERHLTCDLYSKCSLGHVGQNFVRFCNQTKELCRLYCPYWGCRYGQQYLLQVPNMLPLNPRDAFNPFPNPKTGMIDPYNLIATDRVRCMNCSHYFHTTEIQAHLLTHTNQQFKEDYLHPPMFITDDDINSTRWLDLGRNRNRRMEKMSVSTFDLPTEDIDVRTMTADELPEPEFRRREIELPRPHAHLVHPSSTVLFPQVSSVSGVRNHNEASGIKLPSNNIKEKINVGEYFEPVDLGQQQSVRVISSAVTLKRNVNVSTYVDRDSHVDRAKVPEVDDEGPHQKNTYEVRTLVPSHSRKPTSSDKSYVDDPNRSLIIRVPQDERTLEADIPSRINTIRKGKRPNNKTMIDIAPVTQQLNLDASRNTNGHRIPHSHHQLNPLNQLHVPQNPHNMVQSRIQSSFSRLLSPFFNCGEPDEALREEQRSQIHSRSRYQLTEHDHISTGLNCTCPNCGGFYCPVCKSTVPPNFRRPPPFIINRDYHLPGDHPQEEKDRMYETRITNRVTPYKKL